MPKHKPTKAASLTFPQVNPSENGTVREKVEVFWNRITGLLPADMDEAAAMIIKEQLVLDLQQDTLQDIIFFDAAAEHMLSVDARGLKAWTAHRSKKELEEWINEALTTAMPDSVHFESKASFHAIDIYYRRQCVTEYMDEEMGKLRSIACRTQGRYTTKTWDSWWIGCHADWEKRNMGGDAGEGTDKEEGDDNSNKAKDVGRCDEDKRKEIAIQEEITNLEERLLEKAKRKKNKKKKKKKKKKIGNKKPLGQLSLSRTDEPETAGGTINGSEETEGKQEGETSKKNAQEVGEVNIEQNKPLESLGEGMREPKEEAKNEAATKSIKADWRDHLRCATNILNSRTMEDGSRPSNFIHGGFVRPQSSFTDTSR